MPREGGASTKPTRCGADATTRDYWITRLSG
jgi:hypothetical protein